MLPGPFLFGWGFSSRDTCLKGHSFATVSLPLKQLNTELNRGTDQILPRLWATGFLLTILESVVALGVKKIGISKQSTPSPQGGAYILHSAKPKFSHVIEIPLSFITSQEWQQWHPGWQGTHANYCKQEKENVS